MRKLLTLLLLVFPGFALAQQGVPSGAYGPGANAGSGTAIALGNTVINPKIASTYSYAGTPAYGDTRQVVDATCTNGGHICTSPTAAWTAADVGKSVFIVLNASGGITSSPSVTTISSVQSATQMTMTGILTGGACTATNCSVVWGHDDTTALKAASDFAKVTSVFFGPYLAAANTLYVPTGNYMFSGTLVNWNGVTGNDLGPNLVGDGAASTIFFMRPDVSTGGNNMLTFRGYGGHYQGFSVEGSNALIALNQDVIQWNCSDCAAQDIRVVNIHNSGSGSMLDVKSTHMSLRDVGGIISGTVVGDAMTLCTINLASDITWEQIFCSNGWRNLTISNIAGGGTGSKVTMLGGDVDECGSTTAGQACTTITASKDVGFFGTSLLSAQNNIPVYALAVDGTSELRLSGVNVGCYNGGAGCAGANGSGMIIASGGKVWASESQFRAYGTGVGVNGPAGAVMVDVGGNCFGNNTALVPCSASTGAGFSGGVIPLASLSHAANTCYVTLSVLAADNLCTQFLDQKIQIIRILASSNVSTTCAVAPVITLTDGTTTQTLTLTTGAATWDSGAVSGIYALGGTLTVSTTSGTCATPPTNLAITYTYQSYGAN